MRNERSGCEAQEERASDEGSSDQSACMRACPQSRVLGGPGLGGRAAVAAAASRSDVRDAIVGTSSTQGVRSRSASAGGGTLASHMCHACLYAGERSLCNQRPRLPLCADKVLGEAAARARFAMSVK